MSLTVETGLGASDAESYLSVLEADTRLIALYGSETDWAALTGEEKERFLRQATRYLDARYAFIGQREVADQALSWPRVGGSESDVPAYIPEALKKALAETVYLLASGTQLFPAENHPAVIAEKMALEGIAHEKRYIAGMPSLPDLPFVTALLRPLLRVKTSLRRV